MNNKYKFIFALSLIMIVYFFGFFTGVKRTFPYLLLYNIKEDIKKTFNKKIVTLSKSNNSSSNCLNDEIFQCFDLPNEIELSESIDLNNFYLDWTQIEVPNYKKLSFLEFNKNKINYLNQDNEDFLKKINLNEENFNDVLNPGIKNVFKIKNKYFAYVAYRKKECALISIFSYPEGENLIDFPCLPGKLEQFDLNGSGGAFVNFNNQNLLTTGTPSKKIDPVRILAQKEDSPYGKVLKIYFNKNNKINYEIFSKGHRNPQGIMTNYNTIFSVEHGPRGGDEINIIKENKNYAWPINSLGSHYNFEKISKEGLSNEDIFEGPLFSFLPSIGISSIEKCPKEYAEYYVPLKCVAVGSMRAKSIFLILIDKNLSKVMSYEKIELPSRIRKFKFNDNQLIAGTDFEGVIIGKLNLWTE